MPVLELETYDISIGAITTQQIAWLESQRFAGIAVLVDANTEQHCWPWLKNLLAHLSPVLISIPAAELNKTLETCQYI